MYHTKIIGYVITFFRLSIGLVLLTFLLFVTGKLGKIKIDKFSLFLLSTGVSMSLGVLCYTKAIGSTSLTNSESLSLLQIIGCLIIFWGGIVQVIVAAKKYGEARIS